MSDFLPSKRQKFAVSLRLQGGSMPSPGRGWSLSWSGTTRKCGRTRDPDRPLGRRTPWGDGSPFGGGVSEKAPERGKERERGGGLSAELLLWCSFRRQARQTGQVAGVRFVAWARNTRALPRHIRSATLPAPSPLPLLRAPRRFRPAACLVSFCRARLFAPRSVPQQKALAAMRFMS